LSWLSRFVKSNLLLIPALWRPNVKAAKDKEGLLKVNRVRSITGVGIKRNKNAKNILLWRPSDIAKIETIASRGGEWILLIKSATNVLKGDNYVFVSPDLLDNKFIVKKGDVITSSILGESDLNLKSINLKIKSLLRETRDEIKSK